jgi:acylphosphatase
MQTMRLVVKGKVQGVFYRASAKDKADELGVTGWVRNLPDRNVEITATATENILQQFIDWCKRGPAKAKVEEVVVEEIRPESFDGFRIIG